MKKKTIGLVVGLALLLGYVFLFVRINSSYPSRADFKTYQINEDIDLGIGCLKVTGRRIEKVGGESYLAVDYSIKSKDKKVNLAKDGLIPHFYQNLSSSVGQNIIEIEGVGEIYDPSYRMDDLDVGKNEEKPFKIYYLLEEEGAYKNLLLINPSLYEDTYEQKFDDGFLYYEQIDLGDVYD
ncbi:MAG: hypothetical protein Q4D88_03435 [Anaerococcus sp.]|nr:hypothetical protein [Anaerococcus sp.]